MSTTPFDSGDSATYGGFNTTTGTKQVKYNQRVLVQKGIPKVRHNKYKNVVRTKNVATKVQTPWSQTVSQYVSDPSDPSKRVANSAYTPSAWAAGTKDAQGRTMSWVKPPPAPAADVNTLVEGNSGYLAAKTNADAQRSGTLNQLNYDQGQRDVAYNEGLRRWQEQKSAGVESTNQRAAKAGVLWSQGRQNAQDLYANQMDTQRGDFEQPYATASGQKNVQARAAEDAYQAALRQATETAKNELSQQDQADNLLGGAKPITYQTPTAKFPGLETNPKSPYAGLSYKTSRDPKTGRPVRMYSNGKSVVM